MITKFSHCIGYMYVSWTRATGPKVKDPEERIQRVQHAEPRQFSQDV